MIYYGLVRSPNVERVFDLPPDGGAHLVVAHARLAMLVRDRRERVSARAYPSATAAQAALTEDFDAVVAGIFDHTEAAVQAPFLDAFTAPDAFPDAAVCIEDFDEDAMWGVWSITLRSHAQLYIVGTPDGPLADLFYDRRRCRLAAIAAKGASK